MYSGMIVFLCSLLILSRFASSSFSSVVSDDLVDDPMSPIPTGTVVVSWKENWNIDWCAPLLTALDLVPLTSLNDIKQGVEYDWAERMVHVPYAVVAGSFPLSYMISLRIFYGAEEHLLGQLWHEAEVSDASKRCPVVGLVNEITSLRHLRGAIVQLSRDIGSDAADEALYKYKYSLQFIRDIDRIIDFLDNMLTNNSTNSEIVARFIEKIIVSVKMDTDISVSVGSVLTETLDLGRAPSVSTGAWKYLVSTLSCLIEREILREVRSIIWPEDNEENVEDDTLRSLVTNVLQRIVGASSKYQRGNPSTESDCKIRKVLKAVHAQKTGEVLVVSETEDSCLKQQSAGASPYETIRSVTRFLYA